MDTIEIQSILLADLGKLADENNYEIYIVGGFVRDHFLGKTVIDIDITVVGDSIYFVNLVASKFNTSVPVVYEKFGTAMLNIGDLKVEFVGTRKEMYDPASRKPIVTIGTLHDDLARRDFTCNAIAIGLNKNNFGQIVDPFNGLSAIELKTLVTPLEPEQTFSDDPLRMMRACRFASQLGFTIDAHIFDAIKSMASRIEIVSVERVRDEFMKILQSPQPSIGLDALYQTGLMKYIFPEIHELAGVDQRSIDYPEGPKSFHHKDVFYHTLLVVDNISKATESVWLRFAALVHDIAKPQTKSFNDQTGWSFHAHEIVGSRMVKTIFQKVRLPMEPLKYVQKLVSLHLRPIALVDDEVTDSAIRRLLFDAGEDIDDLMTLCRADITSKNPAKVKQYVENYSRVIERMKIVEEKDKLRNWQPPLRGDEIMEICDVPEGALVGILKTKIEDAILDGIIPNDHVAAKEYLLSIKDEIIASSSINKPVSRKKQLKSLPLNIVD